MAPTVALVANSMADALDKNKSMIPGLNWAAEVDKEKAARKSVCTVKIGQDEDKAAKEALDEERNKKGRQTSRYRTVSSSSSASAIRTDDDDFVLVGRRRRGHKPRDDPVQRRLEKERRLAAEERRGTRDSNRDPRSKTYRIPRITVVLTEQQRQWYQATRCLHCGGMHRVYNCKERGLGKEKASTLLRRPGWSFRMAPVLDLPAQDLAHGREGRGPGTRARSRASRRRPSGSRLGGAPMRCRHRCRQASRGSSQSSRRSTHYSSCTKMAPR